MRRLPPPAVDDRALLHDVVQNKRLQAAAVIRPFEAAVAQRYVAYGGGQGNPWTIARDHQFQPPRASFHNVYLSPPRALSFIDDLRDSARGACPMCGSDGNGTLDHYLPKAEYPEFSFFSLNLIPACFRCNVRRRANYMGVHAQERPLHPYYDNYAAQRILSASVVGPLNIPVFKAIPWNPPPGMAVLIRWHIENVVEPAGFARHCQQRWSRLLDDPQLHLGPLANDHHVAAQLAKHAAEAAHLTESPNSWDSCFFHGVSTDAAAVQHLTAALAASL
jgi:hypothetical protein